MLNSINYLNIWLKCRINNFLRDEKGEVNIIAIVVLIGIAIVLALIFKDRISKLLKSMLDTVGTNASNAMKPE